MKYLTELWWLLVERNLLVGRLFGGDFGGRSRIALEMVHDTLVTTSAIQVVHFARANAN